MKNLRFAAIALLVLLFFQACKKEETAFNNYLPTEDKTPPALLSPFASVATANRFVRFGDTIPGTAEISKGYWISFGDASTRVVSCNAGIVTNVEQMDNGEWRIGIKTKSNSIYTIFYENVKDLQVSINDEVLMGTILGTAGQGAKAGLYVAQNGNLLVCPKIFGAPGFDSSMATALSRSNAALGTAFADPCVSDTLR